MKLYTLGILIFGLTTLMSSCSGDDDATLLNATGTLSRPMPDQSVQGLRIKKVTQVTYLSASESETEINEFFYTRNRLDSTRTVRNFSVLSSHFHYNGTKVTEMVNFANGQPNGIMSFYYIGSALEHTQTTNDGRTYFTYSGGHVRTIKSYSGPNLYESRTFNYSGNNISEELRETFILGSYISRNVYTYDSSNNPTMGMNKYLRLLFRVEGFNGLSDSNPLMQSSYAPVDSTTPNNQYYIMEYNGRNYPFNIKRYYEGTDFLASDTTIEYE